MHPSASNQNHAPTRRPPRRWKSSSTAGSIDFLDDISEVDVFCPPSRNKSADELQLEMMLDLSLLAFDDNEEMGDGDGDDTSSLGSNWTARQQAEPGRFVTPAVSFQANEPINEACQGVDPVERVTVDPYQLISKDLSFRLPLVGPLTDKNLFVKKQVEPDQGRKTINLNLDQEEAPLPPMMVGLDIESRDEVPPPQDETVKLKRKMFGSLKRESRRLVSPGQQ